MEVAKQIVAGVIAAFVVALLYGGLADMVLYLRGQPTITDFLRTHPRFYWLPLAGFLAFAIVLAVHLFVEPWFYTD